jgi:serine/threonine protein kinase
MEHGPVSFTELAGDDGPLVPLAFYGQYRYAIEDAIGGRFVVHDRAGGAFGEVYLCYDREQEYFYALKTFRLSQKTLDDPPTLPRLLREVDKWIALGEHDHVVQCFALEVIDNVPFLLLEWVTDDDKLDRTFRLHHQDRPMFLDWHARLGRRGLPLRADVTSRNHEGAGTTLANWLRRYHTLPLPFALQLTLDICAGIQHAQQVHPGFVHCDLKPSNVLITERLHAKVTDFGAVRIVQELLDFHLPSGTNDYMAPEQWRGEKLDARADIYAIGCTLFEMLAEHAPFSAPDRSREELRYQHEHVLPPSLHGRVPAAVEQIVRTCLAKDPRDRFPTLDAMIDVLEATYSAVVGHKPRQTMGTPSQTVQ